MAITKVADFTSNKFYPSNNPINCTITSNNNGACNFRYICDLYINGTKVFTDKLFPDPTTGYGFFQLSRVIQDYIESEVPKTPYTSVLNVAADGSAPTAALQVYCRFGEEYDSSPTCDGTVTQFNNLSQSNTFYVYQGVFDYEDFPSYDYTDYLVGTNSNAVFLTNSPREIEVSYNDSYYLDFIALNTITASYSVEITGYNLNNTVNFTNTYTGTLASRKRYRLAVGPYDINKIENACTISQDIKSYDVKMKWMGTDITETFSFTVKSPNKFRTRLGFIGRLGGIEHFTFYHRNNKTFDIERKNYEKLLQGNYAGNWKYEVGDRGTTTYGIKSKETHKVSTYCRPVDSEWLYEMWLSPTVWTYRRPELIEFRTFADGSSRKFWLPEDHGLVAGDEFFCFPDENYNEYKDKFTVVSVNGNIVDCGLLTAVYIQDGCGWIQKKENWSMLPVNISDGNIEVKQKTGKQIQYSLNYAMAYQKNTLRG